VAERDQCAKALKEIAQEPCMYIEGGKPFPNGRSILAPLDWCPSCKARLVPAWFKLVRCEPEPWHWPGLFFWGRVLPFLFPHSIIIQDIISYAPALLRAGRKRQGTRVRV